MKQRTTAPARRRACADSARHRLCIERNPSPFRRARRAGGAGRSLAKVLTPIRPMLEAASLRPVPSSGRLPGHSDLGRVRRLAAQPLWRALHGTEREVRFRQSQEPAAWLSNSRHAGLA